MLSGSSALAAWSYGLAAFFYGTFTITLFVRGYARQSGDKPRKSMLLAVTCSAIWGIQGLVFLLTDHSVFLILVSFFDALRYIAWYFFLLALLQSNRIDVLPSSLASLKFAALLLSAGSLVLNTVGFWQPGLLGESPRIALYVSLAQPVFALVLVEQLFRNVSEDSRWNLKPVCLGLAGTFLFDVYLFSQAVMFNRPDDDAIGIRAAVHAMMVPLLFLSSSRRNDWTSKISVSRKAAFHSATLLIAGVYLLFISGVGYYVRYFGGEWGRALQLGLMFSALILLIVLALSGSVRAKLRVFLGKHFFRYRYDYREEWLKFTHTLSARSSPQNMGFHVVQGLAEMLESPGGGLWMRSRAEPVFSQTARWNIASTLDKEDATSSMCQFMVRSGWVINLEEFRSFPRRYGQLSLPAWLQAIPHAWLIVPLAVGEDLIGFVVLARARTRMDVNWEVNDLLKTAGRQAASFLAQMQATETLLEVRKFDSFNKMSAFVVHDLKNIVTQLSLMLKNAKRLHGNPEFQQDMLITVENSLDRMRQLMLQLREGATPPGTPVGVDLIQIVRRVEAVALGRGRTLKLDLVDDVATRGHEERLERIIGHIVQNAFDATDPSGRVCLLLQRAHGQALIEISDTGSGMTQEFIRDRLFKPFQSTKQAGMGIGAYESFQYVQELGGKIDVESQPGEGTRVTIRLPLFETQKESDLIPLHIL